MLLLSTTSVGREEPVKASRVEQVRTILPEFDRLAEATLKKTGVPGLAVAIVCDDQVLHLKGFGIRQVDGSEPVDADTVFQLASVSKPITSTILASQVGKQGLNWDDRVIDLDPAFRLFDPLATRELTLRDLLCHRSGLPDHAGDLLEDLGYGRTEVLHRLRFLKQANPFRARYAYTNFGYTEGAVATAKTAGVEWEELADTVLFKPLGMSSSSFRHKDYVSAKNRAHLHVRAGERWEARHDRQPDAQAPAGGACSTARDMAQWVRLQLGSGTFEGKTLIAPGALAETHRPQIVSRQASDPAKDHAGFYGLGWNVEYDETGKVRLSHSGAVDQGAATVVMLWPADRLGIVVLSNGSPIGVPESLGASFYNLVSVGKVEKDWLAFFQPYFATLAGPPRSSSTIPVDPALKRPHLAQASYLGTYQNAYYGPLEVVAQNDGLQLRLGPTRRAYPMRHLDGDAFVYQPVGEMAGGPSRVDFRLGPGQKATQVVLEDLDVHGQERLHANPPNLENQRGADCPSRRASWLHPSARPLSCFKSQFMIPGQRSWPRRSRNRGRWSG